MGAHPRNMLIAIPRDGRPKVSLLDFGLAVNAQSWPQGGWLSENVAGDGRYWPASSWLVFAEGKRALLSQPQLREEYEARLDFHSVGVSCLQVFLETVAP